ncbi:MAG TPA: ATP-binding protein [Candidatus Limnocylindrales bacterium]|nr:ATP-binding protein [Candidatus Limnocylindrales bacterium]
MLAVATAALIRWLLTPLLGYGLPYVTFYFATIAAAWVGGIYPGLLSVALGALLGAAFFTAPDFSFTSTDPANQIEAIRLVVFILAGTVISVLSGWLHSSVRAAELRAQDAEASRQRLQEEVENRRRAEQEARDQRETLRLAIANVDDGVIATDTQGLVTLINGAAESLIGRKAADVIGKPVESIFLTVNETTRRRAENPVVRALREGGTVTAGADNILVRRDGSERAIEESASPMRDGSGRVTGCLMVFRDITERRKHESMIREGERKKSQFLATLAHELRNPLAPLSNSLEVMKRAEGDMAMMRQIHATMDRQVSHLVRLVDDLMDTSRINRGRLQLRKRVVEVSSVVQQAVEACRQLAECSQIEVEVALPDEQILLEGDPVRLVQIFTNLLNNACKFSQTRGRIWVKAEKHGDDQVIISVRDAGAGIDPEMLDQVFDMFVQADSSLERTKQGLGIGLTLVKQLVEMHGGSVEARSEGIGRGSEFLVRLPALTGRSERSSSEAVESMEQSSNNARRRILIVDDNQDSTESLAMLLKLKGNETHTAFDGVQAVQTAEAVRPDLILMDIGMPKLNGYDAARRIRQEPWGKNLVLIALTGWGQQEDLEKSRQAGFDGHLVKPVAPTTLMELLATLPKIGGTHSSIS